MACKPSWSDALILGSILLLALLWHFRDVQIIPRCLDEHGVQNIGRCINPEPRNLWSKQ